MAASLPDGSVLFCLSYSPIFTAYKHTCSTRGDAKVVFGLTGPAYDARCKTHVAAVGRPVHNFPFLSLLPMKPSFLLLLSLLGALTVRAQVAVDLRAFDKNNGASVVVRKNKLEIRWPVSTSGQGSITFDLQQKKPLFNRLMLRQDGHEHIVATGLQPEFILTVGQRDLISQNGWNIFFDKVPSKPFQSYRVALDKRRVAVRSEGSRTTVSIGPLTAASFQGTLEVTLYNGSPLLNVAAVLTTPLDSTAIVYDGGLVSKNPIWNTVSWSDTTNHYHSTRSTRAPSQNVAVKYRTILGETDGGSLAVFPAPHQYFYPLDEAFNLNFTWFGSHYRQLLPGYGLGIRQDLYGDKRYVPWFNAPPNTAQRLHFYCLLGTGKAEALLENVKAYTHQDTYVRLPEYKTMASHFHNEYVMNVLLAGKPWEAFPEFVGIFKQLGLDIVHLAEFHYTAHPKGPDAQRLKELATLFELCKHASDSSFLLLPGEEPNEFLGGHWLALFPKPVYWVMAKPPNTPFVQKDATYGNVYHVGNQQDMLRLLEMEKGLAWTAHPRTKGSTGYPDKYKNEGFFTSDRFLGAAWKPIPADLSQPRLGKRVLDLLDDMNTWGLQKKIIAEADLFSVTFANEMYAHMNVNYVRLPKLPAFTDGWQPVLEALEQGNFFSTTGEVLIPEFSVGGKRAGALATLSNPSNTEITFQLTWTFPMAFAEIISGDGQRIYRQRIALTATQAFGQQTFHIPADLTNRKWVRLEAWDVAANGAFTQTIYLSN